MTEDKKCFAHRHRSQVPLDVHHIWPLGEGGPNESWNRIPLCPTAHREVHEYLRLLKKGEGKVAWLKRRLYGTGVRAWAELGYAWITQRGPRDASEG